MWYWNAVTVFLAVAGAIVWKKLNLPSGYLLGALATVAVFNVITGKALFPESFSVILQCVTGCYAATKVTKEELPRILKILPPALIFSLAMCFYSVLVSLLLHRLTGLGLVTMLFSTSPGGVGDMALLAIEFGGDSAVVAVLQVCRLLFVVILIPSMIRFIAKRIGYQGYGGESGEGAGEKTVFTGKQRILRTVLSVAVAIAAGLIGKYLKIPAGGIIFSLAACIAVNMKTGKIYLHPVGVMLLQIFSGAISGVKVSWAQLVYMASLWKVILPLDLSYILLNLVAAWLFIRFTKVDIVTALYATASGGMTDMAILAGQAGADSAKVISVHVVRYISILVFYPLLSKMILAIL